MATKGAFSKARQLLNSYAFMRLNEVAVDTFYETASYDKWLGHRLLSCDGSRLVLPNHPTVIEEFGQHKFGLKSRQPSFIGIMLHPVRCT
jgi:hypothetical protein